jgi:hypothetical protein
MGNTASGITTSAYAFRDGQAISAPKNPFNLHAFYYVNAKIKLAVPSTYLLQFYVLNKQGIGTINQIGHQLTPCSFQ